MKRRGFCLILLFCLLLFTSCASDARREGVLQIYFLDVGQGDCTLLRTDGGDILIDAGPESSQDLLCLRLEQLGVTELTLAVFSHPDEDHIGGADGVLERFPAREVWLSGAPMENESAKRALSVMESSGALIRTVDANEFREIGALRLSVLSPYPNQAVKDGNENSIVMMATYGETELLLTGDIGVKQEAELMDLYNATYLDCDIYKVAHHGSNTSSSEAFLEVMTPEYAVISCGAENSYGHPFGEVLERLDRCGAETLRTDLLGEILFESDGRTLRCLSVTD